MCSFLSFNSDKGLNNIRKANRFLQQRGPDATNIALLHGHTFLHNLLSITGQFTLQPLISDDGNIVCLFNGEIYNFNEFGDYKSDGECLLDLYAKHGNNFATQLNGEFAIVLYDFTKECIVAATDPFRTKPLWIGNANNRRLFKNDITLGFSSYKSALERYGLRAERVPANTTRTYGLNSGKLLSEETVHPFDVTHQHKESYKDWITACNRAILKRVPHASKGLFIGLSSGYDSGVIAACLHNEAVPFTAFSMMAREDQQVLEQRAELLENCTIEHITKHEYQSMKKALQGECEPVLCAETKRDLTASKGSVGMYWVCTKARENGLKVQLSGQGADEVFSDYGMHGIPVGAGKSISDLAGRFPEKLEDVFPWRNFYEGNQQSFLEVNEHVSGIFGIETRYPFLDPDVVQEFLWLSPNLKNEEYKAPLDAYLREAQFPYAYEQKTGFSASSNLG